MTLLSTFKRSGILGLILGLLVCGVPALSAADSAVPNSLKDIGITEKPGAQIPKEAIFQDENGNSVTLGSFIEGKKPVILNLVYFNCPMLCNLVLSGFTKGLETLPMKVGEKFEVISISIDPSDTPKDAKRFKQRYVSKIPYPGATDHWHFLVGTEDQIKKVAQSVGFEYKFNPISKEYAHAAALFFLSPEGKIARYLYGIDYKAFDLKMALIEASERKQISTVERVLLFCYNYDAHTRGYALYAINLMKVGGGITLILLVWLITRLNKKIKPQHRNDLP